uniref:t-SNARE coiled-coil homology domain-containing protein n=1 Tax=Coptotermes formosanus TaxID=36987 RepID=R4UM20_COPFO|nr:hypothetical protein [Coptotermes formosanus]
MSQRFDALTAQVQGRLDGLATIQRDFGTMDLDTKRQSVARAKRDLQSIHASLQEMERLIQLMPKRDQGFFQTDMNQTSASAKDLDQAVAKLEADLAQAEQENRDNIAKGGLDGALVESNRQAAGQVMDLVNAGLRITRDTAATQNRVMNTLADDRALLGHIASNVGQIQDEADSAMGKAKRMMGRVFFNGCMGWIIAIVLILIAALIFVVQSKCI